MGVVYFKLENYTASQRSCEKAIKLKPDYARAWDNLAAALGAQDKLDEAITACENAIKAQYDFPEAWLKLGIIYFNRDEYPSAEIAFEKASALEGCRAYCLSYLAMIDARQREYDQARQRCLEVLEADPQCEIAWLAWNETSVGYYEADRLIEALECSRTAARLRPDVARVWFNLGLILQRSQQFDEAREAFSEAVRIDPEDSVAWHNLGIICLELKDMEAAKNAFDSEHHVTQQLPRRADVKPDFTMVG
jgi:tetratricopeptide (TPR) repeat protein